MSKNPPALMFGPAPITMTSLELVDFINSQRSEIEAELRHDHFMAKVPKVLGDDHAPKFREMVQIAIGSGATRQSPIYAFPKREACLMAMSYSYDLQAKVFDRMTALESQVQALGGFVVPRTYAEAMRLAADQMEKSESLSAELAIAAPKAEVCDRISDAEGSVSIREACNTLRVPERKFVLWLQQHNWTYRRSGHKSLLGYSDKVKAGCLYLKQTPIRDIHTGEERLSEQVRITPLGLTVLAKNKSLLALQSDV